MSLRVHLNLLNTYSRLNTAKYHKQPVGPRGDKGLSTGTYLHPTPGKGTSSEGTLGCRPEPGERGGGKVGDERGSKRGERGIVPVCEPFVLSAKERRLTTAGDKPEALKQIHHETEIHDGRARVIRDLLQENDWMATIDLKDVYLSVAIAQKHRHYLRFKIEETLSEFQCWPFGLTLESSQNC